MTTQFNGKPVAGGTYPALIFKTFMKNALAALDEQPESFPEPSYGYSVPVAVTLRSGELARDNGQCKDVRTMVFFSGFEPSLASCAPNEVEVPNVLQAEVDDAIRLLAGQQLNPHVLKRPAAPGEPVGVVLEQRPIARSLRPALSQVQLIVAESPSGEVLPKVTDVPAQIAIARLENLHLVPQVTYDPNRPNGYVWKQFPAAGTAIGPGNIVRLVVGSGPEAGDSGTGSPQARSATGARRPS